MSDDKPCVFCEIVADRAPAKVLHLYVNSIVIAPLNPVVEGHALVISRKHVVDARDVPIITADVFDAAADYLQKHKREIKDFNLITSGGKAATQTVNHLHVHIVPRREGDGLVLPWTAQQAVGPEEAAERLAVMQDQAAYIDTFTNEIQRLRDLIPHEQAPPNMPGQELCVVCRELWPCPDAPSEQAKHFDYMSETLEEGSALLDAQDRVWTVVRDGGMVTRPKSDSETNVESAGIAWLQRVHGPLTVVHRAEPSEYRV